MNEQRYPRVVVRGEFTATVELPEAHQHDAMACEDPAFDAVLGAMPDRVDVLLWGEDKPPARVTFEYSDADLEVEEDEREPT